MLMVVFSYIVELSFFCVMFTMLKIYIICMRKLFIGGGERSKKKKKRLFIWKCKKKKIGSIGEPNQFKNPQTIQNRPSRELKKKKKPKYDQICLCGNNVSIFLTS
jgi:hypothetical protein